MGLYNFLFSHHFHYEGHSTNCILPIRSSSRGPTGNSAISDPYIMKETTESQLEDQQSNPAIKPTDSHLRNDEIQFPVHKFKKIEHTIAVQNKIWKRGNHLQALLYFHMQKTCKRLGILNNKVLSLKETFQSYGMLE